ncbi:MAG TPA: hypothetical protein VLQ65_10385 [Saliniramus sp.]|nr:hypothetical protein [Saliniramus sp.]
MFLTRIVVPALNAIARFVERVRLYQTFVLYIQSRGLPEDAIARLRLDGDK